MLTHIGTQVIETERLILRPFQYSDDDAMLKYWIADEKIQSMYSEPVYSTKEDVKGLLDKYIGSYKKDDYYRWAVIDKANNECIGQIAYFLVDNKNHFAEIEYCIGSDFQCRGYATEATKAVIDYGFNKINLHKVQICTKTINKPSKRVIEKCGFTYEGTLRDYFYMNNQYIGRLYFSILREEYENKTNPENRIKTLVKEFEQWAIKNNWSIELASKQEVLPKEITNRYKNIPKEWISFITSFHMIINESEDMWFLTCDSFREGEWRYNEFEIISLDAAFDDEDWAKDIKEFWDNTLPIIMSVGGGYQYYAIEISSGKVVQGWEPEFEEVEYVANSFVEFIEKIISGEIELEI